MSLVRNERLKLFATYLNGLAIATFAVGGLAPVLSVLNGTSANTSSNYVLLIAGICFLASAVLHSVGSLVLRRLVS